METLRFTLLGVGAMNSPRYAPAGLVAECGKARVAFDGGPGAEPAGPVAAWLVTDEHAELIVDLRRLAAARGLVPRAGSYAEGGLDVTPHPVVHTSHPTVGYLIAAAGRKVAWAPEFLEFPGWVAGSDLIFADAAGWARPIRFAHGAGGHAAALTVAKQAIRGLLGQNHRTLSSGTHLGRPYLARSLGGPTPGWAPSRTRGGPAASFQPSTEGKAGQRAGGPAASGRSAPGARTCGTVRPADARHSATAGTRCGDRPPGLRSCRLPGGPRRLARRPKPQHQTAYTRRPA